jgi:uncharacterized protein DUF4406
MSKLSRFFGPPKPRPTSVPSVGLLEYRRHRAMAKHIRISESNDVSQEVLDAIEELNENDWLRNPNLINDDTFATGEYARDTPRLVYIAGPMSDKPNANYIEFHAAVARLEAVGIRSENPAQPKLGSEASQRYGTYIRRGVLRLMKCDAIMLLPDWDTSSGATLEALIAYRMQMPAYQMEEVGWYRIPTALLLRKIANSAALLK